MSILGVAADLVRPLGPVGALSARVIEMSSQGLVATERTLMSLVRDRFDAVSENAPRALPAPSPPASAGGSPRSVFAELLQRAVDQNAADGRDELYARTLSRLVPDEALILDALGRGLRAPTVTIRRRSNNEVLLANASLVGRIAAVTVPSMTTSYVKHLLDLGLAQIGSEDRANGPAYELLLADREVRAALRAGGLSKVPARVERATLVISEFGRRVWDASHSEDRPGR